MLVHFPKPVGTGLRESSKAHFAVFQGTFDETALVYFNAEISGSGGDLVLQSRLGSIQFLCRSRVAEHQNEQNDEK